MEMEMKAFIEKTSGKEVLWNKVHERYLWCSLLLTLHVMQVL